jgi:glycosyltransferase involved in cell wall biosynthesis
MTNNIYLSVIIPAFNESQNFKKGAIDEVYKYLKAQKYSFEIIFVDDGSTDNTIELLTNFSKNKPEIVIISNPHMGKGPTVYSGMMRAKGENRLFTDFDQATPIKEVEKLLPFRLKGFEVIIGSREGQGAKREKEPFYRHLMGRGFNLVVKIFAVRGIDDTQCGFKLLSQKATLDLLPKLSTTNKNKIRKDAFTGAFDVELLFLAKKNHYQIAQVPVFWKHVKSVRVDPIKDSIRMFIEVIIIRLNAILGKYN